MDPVMKGHIIIGAIQLATLGLQVFLHRGNVRRLRNIDVKLTFNGKGHSRSEEHKDEV